MEETFKLLLEMDDIIDEYDYLLDKSVGYGMYSSSEYERMDYLRNRAKEIIKSLMR